MNDEAKRKSHRRRYHQRKDSSAKLQRDAISSFADSGSAYLSSRCSAMTVCDNSLQRSSAKGRKGRPWPRLLLFLSAMKRNGSHFRLVPLSTSFVDLCLLRPPARTRFPTAATDPRGSHCFVSTAKAPSPSLCLFLRSTLSLCLFLRSSLSLFLRPLFNLGCFHSQGARRVRPLDRRRQHPPQRLEVHARRHPRVGAAQAR